MTTPIHFDVTMTFMPRIVTAFRQIYPTVTTGLTDDQVPKAVLSQFISLSVSGYESNQAAAPAAQQVIDAQTNLANTRTTQTAQSQADVKANVI